MSIPTDSFLRAVTYFVLLPIVFPLWLTLPDTRKQSCKFPPTFLTLRFSGRWGGGGREPTSWLVLARYVPGKNNICRFFTNYYSLVVDITRYSQRVRYTGRLLMLYLCRHHKIQSETSWHVSGNHFFLRKKTEHFVVQTLCKAEETDILNRSY